MNRFVIFRAQASDGGLYHKYWYRQNDGHQVVFPSCEMLIEGLTARTNTLRQALSPWTVQVGPSEGFEFVPNPEGGLYRYLPFSPQQLDGIWEELCK